MTGKIRKLNFIQRSGFIETPDRQNYHFDLRAVLAYDVAFLAEGHSVTFEIEKGSEAVNICLQRAPRPSAPDPKRRENSFRYLGFDQAAGIRTHRFERVCLGARSERFAVHTDTSLFAKLRIGIQEGPTLCLRLLDDGASEPPAERSLTEQHMLAYLASKPVPARRSPPRRAGRPASAS